METIIVFIVIVILSYFFLRYGYILMFSGFNIYAFTFLGEYYWILGVILILIFLYVFSEYPSILFYVLITMLSLNVIAIIISIFSADFILLPIFFLNLFIIFTFYKKYTVDRLKLYFSFHFGMSYEEALENVKIEKFAEWGIRLILANILNVFSFMLKPFTDEYGHKIFGSTELREALKIIKAYEHYTYRFYYIATFSYLILILIYNLLEKEIYYALSYLFVINYILKIF